MIGTEKTEAEFLTPRQVTFVAAVLASPTIEAASKTAGVTGRCGRKWMKLPAVRAAILRERTALIEASTNRIAVATVDALDFLHSELKSKSAPPAAKLAAARVILQHSATWLELQDLAARVAALEEAHELEAANRAPRM